MNRLRIYFPKPKPVTCSAYMAYVNGRTGIVFATIETPRMKRTRVLILNTAQEVRELCEY